MKDTIILWALLVCAVAASPVERPKADWDAINAEINAIKEVVKVSTEQVVAIILETHEETAAELEEILTSANERIDILAQQAAEEIANGEFNFGRVLYYAEQLVSLANEVNAQLEETLSDIPAVAEEVRNILESAGDEVLQHLRNIIQHLKP